jgi:general secretion pathway protein E
MNDFNSQTSSLLKGLENKLSEPDSKKVIDSFTSNNDLTLSLQNELGMESKTALELYADILRLDIISELPPSASLSEKISLKFMHEFNLLVINLDHNQIQVITSKPYDSYALKAVRLAIRKSYDLSLASTKSISQFLEQLSNNSTSLQQLSNQLNDPIKGFDEGDIERLKDLASEAPIVRLVNILISRAMELRASDIHFEPFEKTLRIRYRVDGRLIDTESPPVHSIPAIVSRIKIMAKMNIAERRLPQDGRIELRLNGQSIELRVATIPSLYGESLVMRLLDQTNIKLTFESLGLDEENIDHFRELINRPSGIILVTGPTGSGKTTTLYSALSSINTTDKKIMTVEDPIEYQLDGIMQMQVKPSIGLTFASALRAIVRQDPDIIMVGEMRDYETANIAIQAALTGHLVLSTLHTNDAGSAITRLQDMGIENYLISSTVIGVVGQRLVRRLCKQCSNITMSQKLSQKNTTLKLTDYNELQHFTPVGCDHCNHSGYLGRTVILEQMTIDDSIRENIMSNASGREIQKEAMKKGMKSMRDDGLKKSIAGITSLNEVMRVT